MQADLGAVRYLRAIATQCRNTRQYYTTGDQQQFQCVTSYYVNVASTAAGADDDFTAVCGTDSCPQLFTGNSLMETEEPVARNEFDWPIAARFVRLNPQSWLGHISLRWEVYGCDSLS